MTITIYNKIKITLGSERMVWKERFWSY